MTLQIAFREDLPGTVASSFGSRGAAPIEDMSILTPVRAVELDLLTLAEDHGFYSGVYLHLGHSLHGACRSDVRPQRMIASSAVACRVFGETYGLRGVAATAAVAHRPFACSITNVPINAASNAQQAGVVIPVQDHAAGPGMVVLIGTDLGRARSIVEDSRHRLVTAATDIHLRALEAVRPVVGKAPTVREIECLRMAALGMTAVDTARALGITSRTVAFHLDNVATKLCAANKVHAVAIGISDGLIRV